MINKYALLLLLCLFELCMCRRRPGSGGSSWNGDPEVFIIAAFFLLPNVGGWISYAIGAKLTKRLETLVWIQNTTLPHWYRYIPDWVNAVVWTILYFLMGYASYMVYRDCDGFTERAALPLALYGGQLLLNWTWTPVLYKFRNFVLGLFHYLAFDLVTALCSASFFFINPVAFYLMLPCLVYMGFQTILTYIFWRLNSDPIKHFEHL